MAESYDTREMKTETGERQIQIRGTVSSLSNLCLAAESMASPGLVT